MASISTYLQKIKSAVYGEEVRGSIHDALEAMNVESSNAIQYASTAKDSAQAAASSAQSSASIATQKANAASASEQAARTSETNAKASETTAAAKATEAASSAAKAKASETAAEAAKAAAETAEEGAEKSREAAADSATNAAASALTAQQYSGKPPTPMDGTWWIWDAEQQKYADSGIGCELMGPSGTSIADIRLISGDHTPGTTDIYTVELTDGTSYNISVYNGRNGTGAGDVLGIWFDLVLPASGWVNGEITIADSRLLALPTHIYFVSANEACREEYLDCSVQPRDITTTGFITFTSDTVPTADLAVNLVRFELGANGTA